MSKLIINFRAEYPSDVEVLEKALTEENIDFKILKNLVGDNIPDAVVELELANHLDAKRFYRVVCHLAKTEDCHVIHQTLQVGTIDSTTGERERRDYSNQWLKDNNLI